MFSFDQPKSDKFLWNLDYEKNPGWKVTADRITVFFG